MKKIKLIGISLFITILMVFSSIATATIIIYEKNNENNFNIQTTNLGYGEIEVVKEVYSEGSWSEGPINAEVGDLLQFRITLTYYNNSGDPGLHFAHDIRVNDTFPPCLDFVIDTTDPVEDEWSDDPNEYLFWDFDETVQLFDNDNLTIEYNATVVNTTTVNGEQNIVSVIWDEECTGGDDIEDGDTLIIIVEAVPIINIVKEVWDPVNLVFKKSITAYSGENIQFRINVSNGGSADLTGVTLIDELPLFLEYLDASLVPASIVDNVITWNLGTINAHQWIVIFLNATVKALTTNQFGINYANVTADGDYNDSDYVEITVRQHLIVDKKVRHPDTGEWVEEIPYIKGCELVRFRVNITYYGELRMKCLVVYDQLSIEPFECLEFADNVYIEINGIEIPSDHDDYYPDIYVENDTFVWCEEIIKVPRGGIYFSWINKSISGGMVNGDNIVIEFDASVIEYCEGVDDGSGDGDGDCDGDGDGDGNEFCQQTNCVEVWLWGCCCEINYWARDCVIINCNPPPLEVNKTVWDPDSNEWVDELETVEGYTIRFKVEFTYYGNGNLTNVSIKDVLPCCLEYADNSNIQETWVSSDKKIVWWNITQNISDCETFNLEFDALVVAPSECGGCENWAYVYGYRWLFCDQYELAVTGSDNATITAITNSPPERPDVTGPTEGIVGVSLSFKASLSDPDGNQMYYKFNWGDEVTGWLGPVNPGEVTETHTWSTAGTYNIKAKAKDIHGAESDWTQYPLTVEIKTAEINISFKKLNLGKVKATVENTGTADLTDLDWEFNISRDSFINFRDVNIDGTGTLASLPAGQIETLESDSVGLKFGMADLTFTVQMTGVIDKTATCSVFLIGPVILIGEVTVN